MFFSAAKREKEKEIPNSLFFFKMPLHKKKLILEIFRMKNYRLKIWKQLFLFSILQFKSKQINRHITIIRVRDAALLVSTFNADQFHGDVAAI